MTTKGYLKKLILDMDGTSRESVDNVFMTLDRHLPLETDIVTLLKNRIGDIECWAGDWKMPWCEFNSGRFEVREHAIKKEELYFYDVPIVNGQRFLNRKNGIFFYQQPGWPGRKYLTTAHDDIPRDDADCNLEHVVIFATLYVIFIMVVQFMFF